MLARWTTQRHRANFEQGLKAKKAGGHRVATAAELAIPHAVEDVPVLDA